MLNEHEIARLKQDILRMEKYKRSKKYLTGKIKYIRNPYVAKLKVEVNYSGEGRGRSSRVRV